MVVVKSNLEDLIFKRELNLNEFKFKPEFMKYSDLVPFVVDTAVYYADRGNDTLLYQPLYYFGIPSKDRVIDIIKDYDIAPIKEYAEDIRNVINKNKLPFKLIGNEKEGWKLMYLGDKDSLNENLDDLSLNLLEENPDALYGLNGKYENGILVDENGNTIKSTEDNEGSIQPEKPKKWKKIAAIGAAAVMIGAAAAYFMYNGNIQKPKINDLKIKITPHNLIYGEVEQSYCADWKEIDISLTATSHHGFKKLIISYGEVEGVNIPEPKQIYGNTKYIDWITYKTINLTNNETDLINNIKIVKDKLYFEDKYNADNITSALYNKDSDGFKFYSFIKVSIIDKLGDISSKKVIVRDWDIVPQIKSIEKDANSIKVVIDDPDNIGNNLEYHLPIASLEDLTEYHFDDLKKIDDTTYIGIINNPSSKIRNSRIIVIDSNFVDSDGNLVLKGI